MTKPKQQKINKVIFLRYDLFRQLSHLRFYRATLSALVATATNWATIMASSDSGDDILASSLASV